MKWNYAKRITAVVLILLMSFAYLEQFSAYGLSANDNVKSGQIVYEMPWAELSDERDSGEWHYAIRSDNGYAVITEYIGHSKSIVIPAFLDGIDVVGIDSGAFNNSEIEEVTVHGNILSIADDAFRETDLIVRANNGTYALYYAEQHGLLTENISKYSFVEGVIDFSDVAHGRIQRRGDSYVLFNALEGSRLSIGSIFWMEDARGNELFFRVLSLKHEGEDILAQVEVPEIKDAIVDMYAQYTIELTEEDFVPADGVIVGENMINTKTRTEFDGGNHNVPVSISLTPAQMTRYIGDYTQETGSLTVSGGISSTISYTVEVVNGELIYIDTEETSSIDLSVNYSRGKQMTSTQNPSGMKEMDDPLSFSVPLGSFIVPTGWFNLDFQVAAQASITGSIDVTFSQETITKKVYNFDTEEWEMLKNNGNASQKKENIAVNAEVKGKVGCKLTMSFKMFFVNLAQISAEGGLKLETAKTLVSTDVNTVPCTAIEIGAYIDIKLYVGVWGGNTTGGNGEEKFGNGIGIKACVFQRNFDHEILTGEKPFELHISLTYGLHWSNECPYGDRCCVTFETKMGTLLEDMLVFENMSIPDLSEYSMPDDINGGKHLGWATSPSVNMVNWILGDENYVVTSDMTLYAIWENMVEVSFDCGDGSSVQPQFVPIGGYLTQPDIPTMDGKTFVQWYYVEDGRKIIWNFEENSVNVDNLVLIAEWSNSVNNSGVGTRNVTYIGDSNVDNWYSFSDEQTGTDYFKYDYVRGVNDEIMGVSLTGIKGNPVNLVIPSSLFIAEDTLNGVFGRELPVLDISRSIFHGISTGDEERIANIRSIRFDINSNPDISYMFAGQGSETGHIMWWTFENLEFVDLSATSITEVGYRAFANCPSLKCVKLPAGIHTIGAYAFAECDSLEIVTIPSGVQTLGSNVFASCKGLKEINLSETLQSIPIGAFYNCTALEKVYLPEGITSIGTAFGYGSSTSGAFYNCTALKNIHFPNALTEIGDWTFYGCYSLEEVQFSTTIEKIGRFAFDSCTALKSLVLPENVTVGSRAFEGCNAIEDLFLPNGFIYNKQLSSDKSPFTDCTGIRRLVLGCTDPDLLQDLFYGMDDLPLTEIVIAGEAIDIAEDAFQWFGALDDEEKSIKLIIEDGVKSIGDDAFYFKKAIKSVELPDSLEAIGEYAFAYTGITSISIPMLVSRIENHTFYECRALKEVTLSTNVTEIGEEAFRHCHNLVSVANCGGIKSVEEMAFSECRSFIGLDNYSSLTTIGPWAFFGCTKLRDIEFSPNLAEIGLLAFAKCDSIRTIDLSETEIIRLRRAAFSHCASLEKVNLPYSLRYMSENAFSYCPKLTEILIPGSCNSIENEGYSMGISNASEAEEQAMGYIHNTWMEGCTNLQAVIFEGPSSVRLDKLDPGVGVPLKEIYFHNWNSIGYGYASGSLESSETYTNENLSIKILIDGPSQIKSYAFMGGSGITEVVMSDSVTSIGEYAFANCNRLELLVMSSDIRTEDIAESAFEGCDELQVYLKEEDSEMMEYLSGLGITVLQPEMYTLTLYANGGKFIDGSEVMSIQIPWCGNVYDSIYEYTEFDSYPENVNGFTGGIYYDWVLKGDAQSEIPDRMPRHDIAAIALWKTENYILDANGGAFYLEDWSEETEEYVWESFTRAELSTWYCYPDEIMAVKDGKAFKGWYYDIDCTEPYDDYGETEGHVFYAGWDDNASNIEYIVRDGSAILTKYFLIEDDDPCVYLPSSIDGLPLTGIAADAFSGQHIEVLGLPDSITDIEVHAFRGMAYLEGFRVSYSHPVFEAYNGMLIRYDYEQGLYELVCYAPSGSEENFFLESHITHIADYAFEGCHITSMEISDWSGLQSIGAYAFANTDISGILMPETLTHIGSGAFQNCANMDWITFGADVEFLGDSIFQGCDSLLMMYGPVEDCNIKTYADKNGHMYNYYPLKLHAGESVYTYMVQAGEPLDLPVNPKLGENLYFTGWYTDETFSEAWKSTNVMPAQELKLYAGGSNVFEYSLSEDGDEQYVQLTQYLSDEQTVIIPETIGGFTVKNINAGCFVAEAIRIAIPDCVTAIEENALPMTATVICNAGSMAEQYAMAHELIVEYFEYELSFDVNGGAELDSVTQTAGSEYELPVPVRSGYSFDGWYTEDGEAIALNENGMFSMPAYSLCLTAQWTLINEAEARIDFTYRQEEDCIVVTGSIGDRSVIRIPDEVNGLPVTAIEPYAFMGDMSIEELVLPGSISEIPANAFRNCGNLRNVTLAEGITRLHEGCFQGCVNLTEVYLPEGIAYIEARAFMNTGLLDVHLPTTLVQIASDAFEDCDQLFFIGIDANPYYETRNGVLYDIADGILVRYPPAKEETYYEVMNTYAIGKWAFSGAKQLTEVHIDEDVWEIGRGAFWGCSALERITGMSNAYLTQIPEECFAGCKQLANFTIPQNITSIHARAFDNCISLNTIDIPASVTTIQDGAFETSCIIYGKAGSEAETYAKENGLYFVEFGSILPERISLSETELTVERGECFQLSANIQPSDVGDCDISWYSSDETVACVDQSGKVRTLKSGTVTIYAVTPNQLYAACKVNIEAKLTGIQLYAARTDIEVGEKLQIGVTFEPKTPTNAVLTWESSVPEVASVDGDGIVNAVSGGETIITARADNGISASITLNVIPPAELTIMSSQNEGNAGDSFLLTAMQGDSIISDDDVVWSSSNAEVATVSSSGVIELISPGFVTISAQLKSNSHFYTSAVFECVGTRVISLPSALKEIGEEAFCGIDAEIIIIPEAVESIDYRAFADCKSLYKIIIPVSVSSIDEQAFEGDDGITLICAADSYAYQYADKHDFPFILR